MASSRVPLIDLLLQLGPPGKRPTRRKRVGQISEFDPIPRPVAENRNCDQPKSRQRRSSAIGQEKGSLA